MPISVNACQFLSDFVTVAISDFALLTKKIVAISNTYYRKVLQSHYRRAAEAAHTRAPFIVIFMKYMRRV